jgi:hypothetical protein
MDINGRIELPGVNELIRIIVNRFVINARQQSVYSQNTTQRPSPADRYDRVLI